MSPAVLAATHTVADPSIGASLMHMVLGLAAVVASILLVSKVLQRLRNGARPRARSMGDLEVLSRQSLGKGVQIAVVSFAGKAVLVGVAGQHISFYDDLHSSTRAESGAASPDPASLERAAPQRSGAGADISLEALEAMLRRSAPAVDYRAESARILAALGARGANSGGSRSALERLRALTERR